MDYSPSKRRLSESVGLAPFGLYSKVSSLNLALPPNLVAGIPQEGDEKRISNALANYSLLVEFHFIQRLLPPGVYIFPSTAEECPSRWYGMIFPRQGWHRGAVFPFILDFPKSYPECCPHATFEKPYPLHPCVDPRSGRVELSSELQNWSANSLCSLDVIAYLKTLFYDKATFFQGSKDPEHPLKQMCRAAPDMFCQALKSSVKASFDAAVEKANEDSLFHLPPTRFSVTADGDDADDADDAGRVKKWQGIAEIVRMLRYFANDEQTGSAKELFLEWFMEEYLPKQFGASQDEAAALHPGGSSSASFIAPGS